MMMTHRTKILLPCALLFAGFVCLTVETVQAQQALSDPCPIPAAAFQQTPGNLSQVQADIDRYTLCIERAQLLKKLNELFVEGEDALLRKDENPGMSLPIPPVQSNVVFERFEVAEKLKGKDDKWTIIEIFGAADSLQAKLAKPDGSFAQIRQGGLLPDGTRIKEIGPTHVIILQEGETTKLEWLQ